MRAFLAPAHRLDSDGARVGRTHRFDRSCNLTCNYGRSRCRASRTHCSRHALHSALLDARRANDRRRSWSLVACGKWRSFRSHRLTHSFSQDERVAERTSAALYTDLPGPFAGGAARPIDPRPFAIGTRTAATARGQQSARFDRIRSGPRSHSDPLNDSAYCIAQITPCAVRGAAERHRDLAHLPRIVYLKGQQHRIHEHSSWSHSALRI